MAISKVVVVDGNNLTVRIDRGVAGRGVTDVEPVEIDNQLYLEFTFSDGTTETVGPVGTIQYIGESPIVIDGPTISLTTVPVTLGGTNATTAAGAMVNLLPSYTGNANKRLGLNSVASGLEWVTDGGGTVTSVNISGGTTGLSFTGGPVTTSGTFTLSGTLDVDNGGTGAIDASGARTNLGAAASATTISAGTGLTGGGDLSANRTLSIANTAVTAGSYGSASNTLSATVNAQGQLTALAATPIAIANTQVSGLGTASTLNAGVALGVATLDAGGTVPLSQIPASIQGGVSYQGSWNAATNTPTIVSSVGSKGYYYVVSVAGSTNINGITDWLPGDWIIFNGSVWEQIDNTDTVQSVNGYVGAVVLTAADVGAPPTTRTITAGTGLSGGGDLSANRTIDIANTAVSAGSYGTASSVPSITVNAQGQLTAASNTTIAIANTQVSGLGTMSTQNANAVAITGGTATLTSLTVNDNTTLGSSNTDTTTFNGRIASEFTPSTANTYDLGRNSHEWRNLYLTGTANISALSASGAVTLSGGTANGVAYLNGSKVLTSGSALTFDGTNFASSGIITSTNANGLRAQYPSSASYYAQLDSRDGNTYLSAVGSTAAIVFRATDGPGTTAEGMRLTSTGLGIGTSSPTQRLEVRTDTDKITQFMNGTGTAVQWQTINDAKNANVPLAISTLETYFLTGGSERMRLDSSGNLGIGTSSPAYKLDVRGGATESVVNLSSTGTTAYTPTAYNGNKARLFLSGGNATGATNGIEFTGGGSNENYFGVVQESGGAGAFVWQGYNGSAYAERMRLDSSGNVGLGVTPSAWYSDFRVLQIGSTGSLQGVSDNSTRVGNNAYYDGAAYKRIVASAANYFLLNSDSSYSWLQAGSSTAGSNISWTQAMTLDASGNLGVGTTSPANRLDVSASGYVARFYADASNYLRVYCGSTYQVLESNGTNQFGYVNGAFFVQTAGAERARIDSSGNLLVGTTVTNSGISLIPSFSSSGSSGIDIKHQSGAPSGDYFQTFQYNAGVIGSITQNGVSQVLYNISSDQRLKDNIQDADSASGLIDSLQVRQFDWKADGSHQRYGFVAQELVTVAPEAVHQPTDPESMMAVDYSKLVPMLVKEIQSLRARVAALESI